jgi:hypothetical protein
MTEPATGTFSLAVIAIAILGPMAGPYALIVFAALAGAQWPLSSDKTLNWISGGWLLLRCTLTAVVLTGAIGAYLQTKYQIRIDESAGYVAFAIGALGNGWRPVINSITSAVQTLAHKLGGQK